MQAGRHSVGEVFGSRQNAHNLASSFPRKTKRMSDLRDNQYKGNYAKLMSFLDECRQHGCDRLPEDKYKDLAQAVDNLSQPGTSAKSLKEHFKGHEKEGNQLLGSMGILVEEVDKEEQQSAGSKSPKGFLEEDKDAGQPAAQRATSVSFLQEDTSRVAELIVHELGQQPPSTSNHQNDVLTLTHAITTPTDFVSKYKIKLDKMAGWMLAIAAQYLAVPYHNWRHALDVFFFSYYLIVQGEADKFFNSQDILALLVSAVGHDVGHFGVNNAFLVATRAELATIYNDEAVLESMHCSKCFATMQRPGLEFMDGLSKKDFMTFRGKVVGAILATDMAHHFGLVDRLAERVKQLEANPFATDTKNPDEPGVIERRKASKADRRMLLQAFLHMADFGKNASHWQHHIRSVVSLEEEFFCQGDRERELAFPIAPMCDRNKDSLALCQGTFIPKVVLPLYEPITTCLNEHVANSLLAHMQDNQTRWADLIDSHGQKTARFLYSLQREERDRSTTQ